MEDADAAASELEAGRTMAATSLAIYASRCGHPDDLASCVCARSGALRAPSAGRRGAPMGRRCDHWFMARSPCTCGAPILWKADEPQSHEWLFAPLPDIPDDADVAWLYRWRTGAAFCPECGRLWVQWDPESDELTEYAPVNPAARPRRVVR